MDVEQRTTLQAMDATGTEARNLRLLNPRAVLYGNEIMSRTHDHQQLLHP